MHLLILVNAVSEVTTALSIVAFRSSIRDWVFTKRNNSAPRKIMASMKIILKPRPQQMSDPANTMIGRKKLLL